MGLVKFALKFRITFYVLGLLILLSGIGASVVANKDVLPNVDIPVVVVVWTYTGLDPTDMASRVTTYSEFALSNNVNGIKRMESTTPRSTCKIPMACCGRASSSMSRSTSREPRRTSSSRPTP